MEQPRAALWLWYRGEAFAGFGRQPRERTVQQAVSEALARLGARPVVMPAGRTDRGVHARMQVVSVRAPASVGARLDFGEERGSVGVVAHVPTPAAFHAQWSAAGRTYRYRLALGANAVPQRWAPFVWSPATHPRLEGRRVAVGLLRDALALLPGTRTFAGFHEKTSVQKPRTVHHATLVEGPAGLVEVELAGDAFGRHQVRQLLGACALVAAGAAPLSRLRDALESGERFGAVRAPAAGLVLWEVRYPPAADPFGEALRAAAPGLPRVPPFVDVAE